MKRTDIRQTGFFVDERSHTIGDRHYRVYIMARWADANDNTKYEVYFMVPTAPITAKFEPLGYGVVKYGGATAHTWTDIELRHPLLQIKPAQYVLTWLQQNAVMMQLWRKFFATYHR